MAPANFSLVVYVGAEVTVKNSHGAFSEITHPQVCSKIISQGKTPMIFFLTFRIFIMLPTG